MYSCNRAARREFSVTAYERLVNYLAALCVVVAFGGLFFGRLMIYPVATAPGTFLQRVAAKSADWDLGHRWMLVGMVALIPAAIGIQRALRRRSPRLVDVATWLTIVGAALGVGQYALDFAMLAAARMDPPEAGDQFVTLLRQDAVVDWTFYRLPDLSQCGLVLFAVALWRQGRGWRLQAALVSLAAVVFLSAGWVGPVAVRTGLGILFAGFLTVAWRMAAHEAPEA
jgi:hypothetical protein